MTRHEFFNELIDRFSEHITTSDAYRESELEEEILNFIDNNKDSLENYDEPSEGEAWAGGFADNH